MSKMYHCQECNFHSKIKTCLERHFETKKHQKKTNMIVDNHLCKLCNHTFASRSGLWSHLKQCRKGKTIEKFADMFDKDFMANIFNEEFFQNLAKSMPVMTIPAPQQTLIQNNNNQTNNTIIANGNNNKFNLNVYLNETCKNAMNMSDFINSLVISAEELENMGKLGYVKGIANILIRGLNEMEEVDRPLHCTDKKREILYIKENDIWQRDQDKKMMMKVFCDISNKNFKRIPQWKEENPASNDYSSKKHIEYLNILSEVMNGITPDDDTGYKKIHKLVCSESCLQKSFLLD